MTEYRRFRYPKPYGFLPSTLQTVKVSFLIKQIDVLGQVFCYAKTGDRIGVEFGGDLKPLEHHFRVH